MTLSCDLSDGGGRPETFIFLLVPGYSMMSLMSALEPLRSLNRLADRTAYRWRFAGLEAGAVEASNGVSLPVPAPEDALAGADYLFVCGGLRIQSQDERRYLSLLRKAARTGLRVGSLSTGSYLLARAGLLNGYRCTIHWENRPAFQEEFPDLDCTSKIYEIDRDRLTCSGGTASMDLVLHLISDRHGPDLARGVANQFHHERIRGDGDDQRGGRNIPLAHLPASLRQAVEIMLRQVEDPLPVPQIARQVGVSSRQLERLFLRHFEKTPLGYYIQLRLERARELLLYSDQPVIDIAFQVGFTSTSHFAGWYRRLYGIRPSQARHPVPRPAGPSPAPPASPSESAAQASQS
jgi:transcriptional regulator GlxA family with amidase domain